MITEIKNVGVIGEGKMGSSLFFYLTGFDFNLSWLCSSDAEKETAQKTFANKTKRLFRSGVITQAEFDARMVATKITASATDLKNCDLIIEAITEDAAVKRSVFEMLNMEVNPDCIFASNSSSITPSHLVPGQARKDKFAGLHFFFPVALKNTVECITTPSTSADTEATLLQFVIRINKTPFLQKESNCFILNKLFLDFQAGAYHIYLEGKLSYKDIDHLVKKHFFPIGVFEFFDHVGIDVMQSSIKNYIEDYPYKEFYAPLLSKMTELVNANCLGIKTRIGFYDYSSPGETGEQNQFSGKISQEDESSVADRLWDYFIGSVNDILKTSACTRQELSIAVMDYMEMEREPFLRIRE